MRFTKAALAAVVFILAFGAASAQSSGGLAIKVVDPEGTPLPGATVVLSHETGNIKTEAQSTGRDGFARFPVLPAGGGYMVEVEFPGFAKRRETARVTIGDTPTLIIQLSEEMVEKVVVTAEQPVVDLDKTTSSTKFSDEFIKDLPVPGRFYQNVLPLTPGVNDADGDGNPNVHGSRSRDFKASVSGVSNVDPLTGQFMSLVNPNSIEEIEVITGGAGVEFGRAQGGFANIVQKQGTNEFEGVFDYLFRSSKLDGTGANDFSNLPEPEFDTNQAGISFSGPIIRDRLWFRLAHDLIDREDPVNVLDGIEVVTTERQIAADQITWQLSPRNKLVFQYQSDPLKVTNFGVSSFLPAESAIVIDNQSETWQVNWTAPYSTKILVNSTFAYQQAENGVRPAQAQNANDCVPDDPLLGDTRCFNAQTGQVSGSHFQIFDDSRERFTAKTSATIYGGQFWGANHQFKLGFEVENERYFRTVTRRPDLTYFVFDFTDVDDPNASPEQIQVLNANVAIPGRSDVRATGNNWAFYVEDQIKPLSNLTITLGGRVDREEINSNGAIPFDPGTELDEFLELFNSGVDVRDIAPQVFTSFEDLPDFVDGIGDLTGLSSDQVISSFAPLVVQSTFWTRSRRAGNIDLANTNFSPFLSVKWDPWSNGLTSFGASYRRYYDKVFLNVPLLELQAPTTNLVYDLLPDPDGEGFVNGGLRNTINPSVNVQAVDRNLKTPYQDEFRFTFEREVFRETALQVEYLRRNYRDQLQDVDLNRQPGDFGACKRATPTNNATILISPGSGQELIDPYTGQAYIDTDPGIGDGILDDCAGDVIEQFGNSGNTDPLSQEARLEQPDGVPDLYVQNPGWGSIFLVGNFNEADYEAFIVSLTRRQYRSWEMQASYTFSEAVGNGEDFTQAVGDDATLIDDEYGYQSNDQRHIVRMNATTITPWGFRLGGTVRWESGLPYSLLERRISFDQSPPQYGSLSSNGSQVRFLYPTGQRNDQRNASMWTFDMKATKEMNIARGMNLQLSAEVFNLLNDDTLIVYNTGLEIGRQINGVNDSYRRFGRSWQLGMKLAF